MLSAGSTRWSRSARAVDPRVVLSRPASYTQHPYKKTGSFDDLIYNDMKFRNKLHVFEPNRIGAPESWKLTAGDLKNTKKKVDEEAFPVPVHRFGFYASPFSHTQGYFVGQQINYDEILPRCKGKLHNLEWKHITEEDRYTARNHFIKTHSEVPTYTVHQHRPDSGFSQKKYFIKIAIALFLIYAFDHGGWAWENKRGLFGGNPDNSYDIGNNTNSITQWPIFGDAYHFWCMGAFQKEAQRHDQYKYPLWTEYETGLQSTDMVQAANNWKELSKISPQWHYEIRDTGSVRPTPSGGFRENHELYYDGAKGPDRIGGYFVKTWKTGEKVKFADDSYQCGLQSTFWMPPMGYNHL